MDDKQYFKQTSCPGSGSRTGGWPGEQDQCYRCGKWVRVRRDETIGQHTSSPYQRGEKKDD